MMFPAMHCQKSGVSVMLSRDVFMVAVACIVASTGWRVVTGSESIRNLANRTKESVYKFSIRS